MAHKIRGDFRHTASLLSAPDVARSLMTDAPMLGT